MKLWIRSQDKEDLITADEYLSIQKVITKDEYVKNPNNNPFYIECSNCILGFYATKERALEVLDEIQNKLKEKYIVKSENILLRPEDEDRIEYSFNEKYGIDAIVVPRHLEITPVNKDIIVYEMPEK